MARVNVGVNPIYLTDQHLIAESVEITMITGSLRKDGYKIKSSVPEQFCLGKGHINFFKNKIVYLRDRLKEVNNELHSRGIEMPTAIDILEFPKDLWFGADYISNRSTFPIMEDSMIVRERIADRLLNPLKAKHNFHRYKKEPISDIKGFVEKMIESKLYAV